METSAEDAAVEWLWKGNLPPTWPVQNDYYHTPRQQRQPEPRPQAQQRGIGVVVPPGHKKRFHSKTISYRFGFGFGMGATGHQASETKDSRHELDVLKSKVWQISWLKSTCMPHNPPI